MKIEPALPDVYAMFGHLRHSPTIDMYANSPVCSEEKIRWILRTGGIRELAVDTPGTPGVTLGTASGGSLGAGYPAPVGSKEKI